MPIEKRNNGRAPRTPREGLKRLLGLGVKKYHLATLLGVDSSTVSQWIRLQRVGIDTVGRIAVVPELRDAISPFDVRPDIERDVIEQSIAAARVWVKNRKTSQTQENAR